MVPETSPSADGWKRRRASVVGATLAALMAVVAVTGLGATGATQVQAREYLDTMAMSREQLIAQLDDRDGAAEAVDALGVDWAEQAAIAASEYVEVEAWTRDSLVAQLVEDGHSETDSAGAVDALTVDWEQQPYDAALNYWELQDWARNAWYEGI